VDEAAQDIVKEPKKKSKSKELPNKSDKMSHKEKKKMKKEVHIISFE